MTTNENATAQRANASTVQQDALRVMAAHRVRYLPATEQDRCDTCGDLTGQFTTARTGAEDRELQHQVDMLDEAFLLATPEHDGAVVDNAVQALASAWRDGSGWKVPADWRGSELTPAAVCDWLTPSS